MISRVKTCIRRFGLATTHNALGSTIPRTWRFNRVFAVKPALCRRKQSLSVAKHCSVLLIGKRAALVNSLVGLLALLGQFGNFNRRQSVIDHSLFRVHAQGYNACSNQQTTKH